MSNKKGNGHLLPADISEILDKYQHLLESRYNYRGKSSIFTGFKRTRKRLEILFPLKKHPIHGITGLHVVENYNNVGYIRLYQYNWKVIIPKSGVQKSHISSWGNDSHDANWTPKEYKVITEPHHHHFDPRNRGKRKESFDVRTLDQAFSFIERYIETGLEYFPQDN